MKEGHIHPAIIAMPSDGLWGDGSGYLPHHDRQFDQWIISDVPRAIREVLPQASEKSSLSIGGLSMGGYGALLLGGRHPDLFQAISAHSALTRFEEMELFVEEPLAGYQRQQAAPDIIEVLRNNRKKLPPLRFDCGQQDQLLEGNRQLHQQLEAERIPHEYQEFTGGHEWSYWQQQVEHTLRFFAKATP